jgi:hypothetical protein
MANGLNIIQFYSDNGPSEWNVSQWRSLSPANAVNAAHERGETPHTMQLFFLPSALNWKHPEVQCKVGMGDVLVFQRNAIAPEVWEAMDYWRALGKAVVVDVDDHYPMIPPSNPAFDAWIRNKHGAPMPPVDAFAAGLKHADGLLSPSKVILQDWSCVIRGYYQPNLCTREWYAGLDQRPVGAPDVTLEYGDDRKLKAAIKPGTDGQIILGWGGSISHVDSWLYSGIIDALDRVFTDWPQARLKFCGNEERLNAVFERWGERVIRQPGVAHADWPVVVSSFDIGLAPLDLRPLAPYLPGAPIASYDERRSWLKGIEYCCAGVPWVGSRSLTYNALGRNGMLVPNTPEAWYAALAYQINHLAEVKREAWHHRKWALRALTLEGQIVQHLSVYERIASERNLKSGVMLPGVQVNRRAVEVAA